MFLNLTQCIAQSAGAVEYIDCIFAEAKTPPTNFLI